MALVDTYDFTRPGQTNSTGALDAQHNIEFTGMLREQFKRSSVFAPLFPMRSVTGTSIIRSFASGKSAVQSKVIGVPMQSTIHAFGKTELNVKGYTFSREVADPLEEIQNAYSAKAAYARGQAEAHARLNDQMLGIAAMKAGLATTNQYGLSAGLGLDGGSQETLASAGDALDPGKLYAAIQSLLVKMRNKDVDTSSANFKIITTNQVLSLLQQCDLLINSEYVTHDGSMVHGMMIKTCGVPVVASNNFLGGTVVTAFPLDSPGNPNVYSGDYSKVLMVGVGRDAVLAGESIPLFGRIWQNFDQGGAWVVDSLRACDAKPDIAAHAGVILLP
jgi:hypothetical protein